MSVARRTWLPLSMLAAGLAGLWVLAWELVDADPARARASDDIATRVTSEAANAAGRDETGARDRTSIEAARHRDDDPLLFPPDPEYLRQLEQGGRALFWGFVFDPGGAPCADATIFAGGLKQATSDTRGAWRIEIDHDIAIAWGGQSFAKVERPVLAARKEGVGVVCVDLDGRSRHIDLTLALGQKLRGRCLDRATRNPVPLTELRFLFAPDLQRQPVTGLSLAATSDAVGRFELDALPAGAFDVRAEADERDSCGYEPFEFPIDGGRAREVTLLLDRKLTIKGHFEPWPPPGGSLAPPPRVVVAVDEPHDRGLDEREFSGEVAADGTFTLQVPSSCSIVAKLFAGGDALWTGEVETEYGPRDVDFGRIELPTLARAHGRVLISPELLELGVVVRAIMSAAGRNPEFDQPVGPDGQFKFEVLPAGWAHFRLLIAGDDVGSVGNLDEPLLLANGDDHSLPPLPPRVFGRAICGRVTDEGGTPIAWASLSLEKGDAPTHGRFWTRGQLVERDGCYVLGVPDRWSFDDDGNASVLTNEERRGVEVRARGFAPQTFAVDLPATTGVFRHDFKLKRAAPFHGRLVDEQGRALAGWRVWLDDDQSDRDSRLWQVTDAGGEFTIEGAPRAKLRVDVNSPAFEVFELAPIDANARDVVLTVPRGK